MSSGVRMWMRRGVLSLSMASLSMVWASAGCRTTGSVTHMQSESLRRTVQAVPPTSSDAVVDTLHGVPVNDPFRWLEQGEAPAVQAWAQEQDGHTRAYLHGVRVRQRLADRFRQLFYVDSLSAPRVRGGRLFYTRTHADKEKAIVYWRPSAQGDERVLLDPNGWSADGTVSLGGWVPSWDGKRVAYATRANAADEATLHVLDVDTGRVSETDTLEGAKYASPAWNPEGTGFYYEYLPTDASIPVSERPGYTELRFHRLGTPQSADLAVFPRTGDPSTFLGGQLSRDGRYLFVYIQRGWNENDILWVDLRRTDVLSLPAQQRREAFRPLVSGKGATYALEAWDGAFYVLTDEGAPRKRIFRVDPATPGRERWTEVVAEDPDATIEDVSIVGGKLAVTLLRKASSVVRLVSLDGKTTEAVELPGLGTVGGVVGNPDQSEAYFGFSSFTTPLQVWKLDTASRRTEMHARVQLPVDTDRFETEQVTYRSKDGTPVSMFLVRAKGLARDGARPVLLYGYGGFDVSLTPSFKASIYPWLEAGGIYAVANLRGGGEYGKAWHDAGRGALKQNVFDDFAAAADWLAQSGWTRPGRIAAYGGSNGGLLTGALTTQRPDSVGAVVCAVPLLDMVRYHLFGSGRTWIPEYGTAEKAEDFKTLAGYSPYHHVRRGVSYPPLLMLSADHDDRVDPMHARKFVAALQQAGAPALLRVEKNAGHGGADQVRQAIEQSADMYAFLWDVLGLESASSAASSAVAR